MWHSLWLRKSLGFLAAAWVCSQAGWAIDSSVGPASEKEAAILWKQAESYYDSKNCEDALPRLRRLIDRYPGHPSPELYRTARFQLGDCYFKLDRKEKARIELKAYLEGAGDHPHEDAAREMKGVSELRLKKFHEAYLSSLELEKSQDQVAKVKALILRARVQIAMNQDNRADASAASALTQATELQSRDLIGSAQVSKLELALRQCASHEPKGRAEEVRVRSETDARALCLNEALIRFKQTLDQQSSESSDAAVALMRDAFQSFKRACSNPPAPPRLRPKDRTSIELKRYQEELKDRLLIAFENERKAALRLIQNWKQEKPAPSMFVLERLNTLEESLQ